MSGIALQLDAESLRPLVREIVAATLAELREEDARLNGRLAYTEPEAAGLLAMNHLQLRDERRKGRIKASVGPKKSIRYSREDLINYLASRRWGEK